VQHHPVVDALRSEELPPTRSLMLASHTERSAGP
jgi:hypothetical protein